MRPITKIFLVLLLGGLVYVLWPRTANVAGFQPRELAVLQVKAWENEQKGEKLSALGNLYQIYTGQYGFSPVASFRIAQSETQATGTLKRFFDAPDRDERALPGLREKYVLIKSQIGGDLSPDDCAREELTWRSLEAEGAALETVAGSMAALMAMVHGGDRAEYFDAALSLVGARSFIVGTEVPAEVTDRGQAAEQVATEGYENLKAVLASRVEAGVGGEY